MTPKEKAKELFCAMYGCNINEELTNIYVINGDGYFMAKDCALICVDEIIQSYDTKNLIYPKEVNYWQEVKKEIEKL